MRPRARGPWLLASLVAFAASGCYLEHHVEPTGGSVDPERPSVDGAHPAMDASVEAPPPVDPDGPPGFDAGRPPDAATFVGPDEELPIASPRADLTCDSGDEELLALCGDLPTVYVAETGRAGATGAADDPFASPAEALVSCGEGCVVRIAEGTYEVSDSLPVPPCAWISGGWVVDDREWHHDGGRSTLASGLVDGLIGTRGRLVVEHLVLRRPHSAISGSGDLLVVRDVDIDAEYSGVSASGASNVRVCRAHIVAGYVGINLSWSTTDVVIEDCELDGGYQGVDIGWSSSRVEISGSTIHGGYEGVGLSWGSSDVHIAGSTITGDRTGLGLSWGSNTVFVEGSEVRGCEYPLEVGDDCWGVKLATDTEVTGECSP